MTSPEREDVTFLSSGIRCAAWLYRPASPPPHPAVILGHGLGGLRKHRLDAFAQRFADAGMAAIAFDYRHFGDSDGEPRQLVNIRRQLQDWEAAVDYVRGHPDVDVTRIALWGTSFSGGHVHEVAARDHSFAAVVAQVPFVDGLAAARATGPLTGVRCGAAAVRDIFHAATRRAPYYVPLAGPPRTLAAMTARGADEALHELIDPEDPDQIAARIFLTLPGYRPGRHANRITCPVLYVVAEHDQVTPPDVIERTARRTPTSEVLRYPADHFDVYTGETFEAVIGEEIRFLARHLQPTSPRGAARA